MFIFSTKRVAVNNCSRGVWPLTEKVFPRARTEQPSAAAEVRCEWSGRPGAPQGTLNPHPTHHLHSVAASPSPPPLLLLLAGPEAGDGGTGPAGGVPSAQQAACRVWRQEMLLGFMIRPNLHGDRSPSSSLGPTERPPGAYRALCRESPREVHMQDVSPLVTLGLAGGTPWFSKDVPHCNTVGFT